MRKYYPGITLFKIAGSLLVLAAHIVLLQVLSTAMNGSGSQLHYLFNGLKIVVPCFYLISGFLVYRGWNRSGSPKVYVRSYLRKLLFLYLLFMAMFALQYLLPPLIHEFSLHNLLLQAKMLAVAFVLNGPYVQLWFIPPLLFGTAAAFWLMRRQSGKAIAACIAASFLAGQLVQGSLRALLESVWGPFSFLETGIGPYAVLMIARYLGYGLTFTGLGALLAKHEAKFTGRRGSGLLYTALGSFFIEIVLLGVLIPWKESYALSISMLPMSVLLFYGVLRIRSSRLENCHRALNLGTMVIFFGHIPLMQLNVWMTGDTASQVGIGSSAGYYVLTLLECIFLTWIMIRWNGRHGRRPRQGATASK
ncbi:acyltransferase family protein [Paenibacillus glufosinatiresistens]|uniref:acyltransferase family protein n=1 Tax=Paenibacillus glufosinatiresistens TaxID=3070657 RepID=UPI00286E7411|nr:acyltransferase family protein [Paenibacillus sp. YX.27]